MKAKSYERTVKHLHKIPDNLAKRREVRGKTQIEISSQTDPAIDHESEHCYRQGLAYGRFAKQIRKIVKMP